MKLTRPRSGERSVPSGIGPPLGFAAATLAAFAAGASLLATAASGDVVMPVIATMFLVFAAGFGVMAWRCRNEDSERVTYADVAGALTLIGLFAAATIDPDQLMRIVAAHGSEN
jgi:hypothetical protein